MALIKLDRIDTVDGKEAEFCMKNKIVWGYQGRKKMKVQRIGGLEYLSFPDHSLPVPIKTVEAKAVQMAPKGAQAYEISYHGPERRNHSAFYFKKL